MTHQKQQKSLGFFRPLLLGRGFNRRQMLNQCSGSFTAMRYLNRLFTYLLTYLLYKRFNQCCFRALELWLIQVQIDCDCILCNIIFTVSFSSFWKLVVTMNSEKRIALPLNYANIKWVAIACSKVVLTSCAARWPPKYAPAP